MFYLLFTTLLSILLWLNTHVIFTSILFVIVGFITIVGDEKGSKLTGAFFIILGMAILFQFL